MYNTLNPGVHNENHRRTGKRKTKEIEEEGRDQ